MYTDKGWMENSCLCLLTMADGEYNDDDHFEGNINDYSATKRDEVKLVSDGGKTR